jgi:hypothetical protein
MSSDGSLEADEIEKAVVERLIDEAGARTVDLMRHAASSPHHYP